MLGVEKVYWYWGWPGAALTFQNPDADSGTLAIQKIAEYRGQDARPIEFYSRKKHRHLYQTEWSRFWDIVEVSEEIASTDLDHLEAEVRPIASISGHHEILAPGRDGITVNEDVWPRDFRTSDGRRYLVLRNVRIVNNRDSAVNIIPRAVIERSAPDVTATLDPETRPVPEYEDIANESLIPRVVSLDPRSSPTSIVTGYLIYSFRRENEHYLELGALKGNQWLACECNIEIEDLHSGERTRFPVRQILFHAGDKPAIGIGSVVIRSGRMQIDESPDEPPRKPDSDENDA